MSIGVCIIVDMEKYKTNSLVARQVAKTKNISTFLVTDVTWSLELFAIETRANTVKPLNQFAVSDTLPCLMSTCTGNLGHTCHRPRRKGDLNWRKNVLDRFFAQKDHFQGKEKHLLIFLHFELHSSAKMTKL